MSLRHALTASFILSIIVSTPLHATISKQEAHTIRSKLKAKKYDQLGSFLKNHTSHSKKDLVKLKKIARSEHAHSLYKAITATDNFKKIRKGLGISTGTFLQTALFMETTLKKKIAHKKYYLNKKDTGLKRTVEYDPHNKKAFIVLTGLKSAYLGHGAKKTVYKSIQYINTKSKIVARAEQSGKLRDELTITKHLQGAPGILELKGFGHHKKHGEKYKTIYSKLYTTGTLRTIFGKKIHLSFYEKVRIAFNLLQGLESMHKRKIVHRDLDAKNYFISIPSGKAHRRKVTAVIADFGWSSYIKNLKFDRAQASIKNAAPEGHFFHKMKGSDYFATDVYALALDLYRLFYEKKPAWRNISPLYSLDSRYKKVLHKLNQKTHGRRRLLLYKKVHGKISNKERFEYIILRMLHPHPKMRGSAAKCRLEMQNLLKKIK